MDVIFCSFYSLLIGLQNRIGFFIARCGFSTSSVLYYLYSLFIILSLVFCYFLISLTVNKPSNCVNCFEMVQLFFSLWTLIILVLTSSHEMVLKCLYFFWYLILFLLTYSCLSIILHITCVRIFRCLIGLPEFIKFLYLSGYC